MITGSIVRIGGEARISFTLLDYHQHPSRSWPLVTVTIEVTAGQPAREALRAALLAVVAELEAS